jgi:hypothetical protein
VPPARPAVPEGAPAALRLSSPLPRRQPQATGHSAGPGRNGNGPAAQSSLAGTHE